MGCPRLIDDEREGAPGRRIGSLAGVIGDSPATGFEADVEAAAAAGISLETFAHLTDTQFLPGQFAEFMSLDAPMKAFVLRVLGGLAGGADYAWFDTRDDAKAVASWMLDLPAFRREPDDSI